MPIIKDSCKLGSLFLVAGRAVVLTRRQLADVLDRDRLLDHRDDVRRGPGDPTHDTLQLFAADRAEIHVGLVGGVDEQRVHERVVESPAQAPALFGGNLRRSQDRPSDRKVAGQDFEDLALLVGLAKLAPQRNIGQIGLALDADLEQEVDRIVAQPARMAGFQGGPGIDVSVNLAAFQRNIDVAAAGIAETILNLVPSRLLETCG
jgi:hypothetical protein